MTIDDLTQRLDALACGRQSVLDCVTAAAQASGAGALLLIGSLGRGGGDAFSDLDLIIVPGPAYAGMDLGSKFGSRVLASLDVPHDAPAGGAYQGWCLAVAGTVLWLDLFTWPAATAAVPADAAAIFDHLGLPKSSQEFIPLITSHADPSAPVHPANGAASLLRIAIAAKDAARGNLSRIVSNIPGAAGLSLSAIPPLLHDLLALIDDRDFDDAVAATAVLIDLAAAAYKAKP